jgi:micrococcal nuclease
MRKLLPVILTLGYFVTCFSSGLIIGSASYQKNHPSQASSNVTPTPSVISSTNPELISAAVEVNPNLPEEIDDAPQNNPEAVKQANLETVGLPADATFYTVTKIVDGDTIAVEKLGTLRLIGIDTPETKDPRKPVQCFGKEATAKMTELISGQKVYLEFDPSQGRLDKYNRTLAYVFRQDGVFISKEMIKQGYAFEYTYKLPYKYQQEFKLAQTDAMTGKIGLWALNTCNGVHGPLVTPTQTSNQVTSTPTTGNISCKYSCTSPDRDCPDFSSHQDAQSFFECCHFSAENDPMKLDSIGVGNGLACED